MDIAEIQQRYPDPWRPDDERLDNDDCSYCVGGAVLMAHGCNNQWPSSGALIRGLLLINPLLPQAQAALYAMQIMDANDSGRFADAWLYAQAALTFGLKNLL